MVLENDLMQRSFSFDGKVWRTTGFYNKSQKKRLHVNSEEVYILPMGSDKGYGIDAFEIESIPVPFTKGDTSFIQINYKPLVSRSNSDSMPTRMTITYYIAKHDAYTRKFIELHYEKKATVDRLEVERMVVDASAQGGGRGEPVFVADDWFFGLEYPASHTRHTDGNTPKADGRYFEKVGNYSYIDLQGRDITPTPTKGQLRLMHFPGFTKLNERKGFIIHSKIAAIGMRQNGLSIHQSFMAYLASIWKSPKSFLHYNNWFDQKAKDLSGDGLLNVYREFKRAIAPYGVKMDAMVADDGWQNKNSIWEPSPKYFPNGMADVKKLSSKLKKEGVGFGLWLSIAGYNSNINWGIKNGYAEAVRNKHFERFGRYYSLSADKYKNEVLEKIPAIARDADLVYYKHDFNDLSDRSIGNNHPGTDRHGHEANLDAQIEILLATRNLKPDIIQNLTNWVWFSPYWLMYSDYLWLLAGDDGTNGNWPDLSYWAMKTSDRDGYFWRMWGDPDDRPLVPISRIMTHGIIKTGKTVEKETLQDWMDYVLMHYGRGTLLKEWYISSPSMNADEWKVLCLVDNWAAKHREKLNRTFYVGGRPDDGEVYGYVGWNKNTGVMTIRNPNANKQILRIPFDASTGFEGDLKRNYYARVVFPYIGDYPVIFKPNTIMEVEVPGYSTMALEIGPGTKEIPLDKPSAVQFKATKDTSGIRVDLKVPSDANDRAELLVIGWPDEVNVSINGAIVRPQKRTVSKLNSYPDFAKPGMINEKSQPWVMAGFDLTPYVGKDVTILFDQAENFESHVLFERKVKANKYKKENNTLWPLTNDTRRETIRLY